MYFDKQQIDLISAWPDYAMADTAVFIEAFGDTKLL